MDPSSFKVCLQVFKQATSNRLTCLDLKNKSKASIKSYFIKELLRFVQSWKALPNSTSCCITHPCYSMETYCPQISWGFTVPLSQNHFLLYFIFCSLEIGFPVPDRWLPCHRALLPPPYRCQLMLPRCLAVVCGAVLYIISTLINAPLGFRLVSSPASCSWRNENSQLDFL